MEKNHIFHPFKKNKKHIFSIAAVLPLKPYQLFVRELDSHVLLNFHLKCPYVLLSCQLLSLKHQQ